MAVDHQNLGALGELGHNGFDGGKFTVRKIGWYVRERDSASDHGDLHGFESVDLNRHGSRETVVSAIRHVDSGNANDWFRLIGLDNIGGEVYLFTAKAIEETEWT